MVGPEKLKGFLQVLRTHDGVFQQTRVERCSRSSVFKFQGILEQQEAGFLEHRFLLATPRHSLRRPSSTARFKCWTSESGGTELGQLGVPDGLEVGLPHARHTYHVIEPMTWRSEKRS